MAAVVTVLSWFGVSGVQVPVIVILVVVVAIALKLVRHHPPVVIYLGLALSVPQVPLVTQILMVK